MPGNYCDIILDELGSGSEHGDFATGGVLTSKPPQLDVQGVGRLALPLSPAQADALAAVATPEPYGKGTATLLDQSVRSSLQVEPEQLSIANQEEWSGKLSRAVRHAAEGLGLPPADVKAELYKLLLYRPGDFFLPHKDTEKEQGMVGTLVITLPSVYEGGELRVRHQGQQRAYFLGGSPSVASKCTFAAFYADCEHEVQRVASGHRLALVYNLLHLGGGPPPAAPDAAAAQSPLRQALAAWQADARGPSKLCVMLEHQYTEAGIVAGLRALKVADRSAGRALATLAAAGLVDVHLAILEKHETGEAAQECGYGGYGGYNRWGKRQRCWYNDGEEEEEEEEEEDEEEEEEAGGYTMEEVLDVERSLDHWVTLDGQKRDFGAMQVDEDLEVLPAGFFDGLEPDEEDYEGYAGNYGPTLDRIYLRAALVVWLRSRRFQILAQNNINGAIAQLAADVAAGSPNAPEFAAGILAHLEKGGGATAYDYSHAIYGCSHNYQRSASGDMMAQLANCLDDLARREAAGTAGAAGTARGAAPAAGGAAGAAAAAWAAGAEGANLAAAEAAAEQAAGPAAGAAAAAAANQPSAAQLADRFLRRVLPQRLDAAQHASPLAKLCQRVGWAGLQPALAALVEQRMARTKSLGQSAALMCALMQRLRFAQQAIEQHLLERAREAAAGTQRGAPAAAGSFAAACAALAPCCALLIEAACSKFEAAETAQVQQAQQAAGQTSPPAAVPSAADMANLLHSLALLGGPEQAQQAQRLLPHAVQRMDSCTVPALLRLQQRFGWAAIQPAAGQLVARCESDATLLPHTLSLLRQLAVHALLPAVGLLPCRTATISGLPLTGLADRLALLSSRAAQQEQRYPPVACLHPACKALHVLLGERAETGCPALLALTRHTATRLKAMAAPLLAAQPNWIINRQLGCSCGDCRIAQSFLTHPTKTVERIRLAEQRRKHLHRTLDATVPGLVTHVTERTGRPYTLVLTKTKRHWEERQAEGKRLAALANELKVLLPRAAPWEGAAAAAAAFAGVPLAAAGTAAGQRQQRAAGAAAAADKGVIDLT